MHIYCPEPASLATGSGHLALAAGQPAGCQGETGARQAGLNHVTLSNNKNKTNNNNNKLALKASDDSKQIKSSDDDDDD